MNYFINNWLTPTIIAQFLNLIILLALLYKFFNGVFLIIHLQINLEIRKTMMMTIL